MVDKYEVGYGKPPKHTQFKPGQSGNPKGRQKKGHINFRNILAKLLDTESVTIQLPNGPKTVSIREMLGRMLFSKAVKGDLKAFEWLMKTTDGLDLNFAPDFVYHKAWSAAEVEKAIAQMKLANELWGFQSPDAKPTP